MKKTLIFFLLISASLTNFAQIVNEPLELNSKAPMFSGVDHFGNDVSTAEILKESDYLVVIFYRGSWCGYCKKHLSELQEQLPQILDKNASIIAVTPEQNESIAEIAGKTGATFSILHDENYEIMKAYNVAYQINKATVTKYYAPVVARTAKANGNDDGVLPIPATYIIGKDGLIKWKHFDADYTQRSSIDDILKVLE